MYMRFWFSGSYLIFHPTKVPFLAVISMPMGIQYKSRICSGQTSIGKLSIGQS